MSIHRCATPSTATALLNFASYAFSKPSRSCLHATRQFTSSGSIKLSSKRKLVTASAYHPSSFDTTLPPPRNSGVPETSIAGPVPHVHDIRPPSQASIREQPSVGSPEIEAQKSQPVSRATQTSSQSQKSAPTKPKRKLRARKAAITLSESAVSHLRELLALPEPKLIRVGVKNKGCSGLAYNLDYVEKPGLYDEEVDQDGVKVLVDTKALLTIIGSEMDWVEDKLSQRFVFKNPNIKEQCGCGESFMV